MSIIEKILNFKLIELDSYSLSVYNLFFLIFIYFSVKAINKGIRLLINKKLTSKEYIDEGRASSISQIIKYIVYIIAGFICIQSLGINVSVIGAVFATLGLGVGFALQDAIKDFISGIIILFEGNVKVGDILEIEELIGTVEIIKLRTSVVKTMDGIYIIVPNSKIVNDKVINWTTYNRVTRFNILVGVAYGSDVELVKSLLIQSAEKHPSISKTKNPTVFFNDFGDSSLQFQLNFWLKNTWEVYSIKSDLRFTINSLFKEHNIQIPFPQRDIHLINS